MKRRGRGRFDVESLRALAGDKVFARGEAYYRDRQVELLAVEAGRVLARVSGTSDYRTELTGHGREIDGECSCQAFENWGFCKHMVATALAANEAGEDGEAAGQGPLAGIRDYLAAQGADTLVEMVMELAERDAALFRKLELAAAMVQADDKTLEARLRKAINEATRTRGYVDYYDMPAWASDAGASLDALAGLASGPRAGLALKLAEHAIARLERAAEHIDDSDGRCVALLEWARDIHLEACRAAGPDPVQLARDLFGREMTDDHDAFDRAAALYEEILGEAGLAEYRRLADEAWQALPPRSGRESFSAEHHRLAGMLDFFAERDGDLQARIDVHAKDLSSQWRYLELARFCLSQGREEEALGWAEEGLWIFDDEALNEDLVVFAVERLLKAGRKQDALAHLWRAFEKAPRLELFGRLRELGGRPARDRALAQIEAWLSGQRPSLWHSPADLLIRALMQENMLDAAWQALRRYDASRGVEISLAEASEATHPRQALAAYAGRIEELVEAGGNRGYEEAAAMVSRMAALREPPEQAAYVAGLKEQFRRRRNFMKLLG